MADPDTQTNAAPAEKVKQFPTAPGIYLMKDAQGRVIYVGKAKNLRSRAGSYFHKTAARRPPDLRLDRRGRRHRLPGRRQRGRCPADGSPADQGHPAEVQPRPQGRQVVSLSADHHRRGLPAGQLHPRAARTRASSSTARFPRAKSLRGAIQVLQRIFKFRTCSLDIEEDDPRWRWFRPCLLHSINQCTAPVQPADRSRELTARHPAAASLPRRQERRRAQGDGGGDARGQQGAPVREGRPAARRDQGPAERSTCAATSPSTPSPRCFTSILARASRG